MKLANRILQILALVGALLSGYFYLQNKSQLAAAGTDVTQLNSQLRAERAIAKSLRQKLTTEKKAIERATKEVQNLTDETLLANQQLLQLRRENTRLAEERDAQELTERRLQKENSRLTRELDVLQATSAPQEEIARYELQVADLQRQILELKQTRPLATPSLPNASAPPPDLSGEVLALGKGASFVVLDIGFSSGVRLRNQFTVLHADSPIAKIQVTEVKENLSIARIMPDSLTKTPQVGDTVTSLP